MLDLGRYTFSVLGSWGSSIGLVLILILVSLYRAKASKNALKTLENNRKGKS